MEMNYSCGFILIYSTFGQLIIFSLPLIYYSFSLLIIVAEMLLMLSYFKMNIFGSLCDMNYIMKFVNMQM